MMSDRLPLICRLRRHGWRHQILRGGWERQTCHRCADVDLPTPDQGGRR